MQAEKQNNRIMEHKNQKHEHHHEHSHGGIKGRITLIALTSLLLVAAIVLEKNLDLTTLQLLFIYLIPYLLIGYSTLKEAFEGIITGDMFNEHFLMSIATIGALCIGFLPGAENEFTEAVFVMLFFQVGELFEKLAEGKSRKSISHLMDMRPDVANVERMGEIVTVSPEQVQTGETIVIRPGEKVPLDGKVIEGSSTINTVALTGESMPRGVSKGDEVMSGCINLSGLIRVKTTKNFGESTVSKIIALVESADENKSHSESFITRFARIYTPVVVFTALFLAFIPPLLSESGFLSEFTIWLQRALIFLVVSCPCALVISVPLTFFGGIGGASRKGILIKGSNYMDAMAKAGIVVFDKTGTLTRGEFAVQAIHPENMNENELLHIAAHVEHFSTHPIGEALRNAFPNEANDNCRISQVDEIAGNGICANLEGRQVCVGNYRMMERKGIRWKECECTGTIIHVAVDGEYAGHIVINDRIKDESKKVIAELRNMGIDKIVMLTGDHKDVARNIAQTLYVDDFYAELLPADKVEHVERLLKEKPENKKLVFVGDGINDAPVLKRADIGIAMGGLGSDAAIEAADIVLMDDKLTKIITAIRISRRTLQIAKENIWFAIGIKVLILLLATVGLCSMWMAVFADVGVTVLAVLNAMRALKIR